MAQQSTTNERDSARPSLRIRLVSKIVYLVSRGIYKSMRISTTNEELTLRQIAKSEEGMIFVTWHGRTLMPIARLRGLGYWSMISTSKDGDYQTEIFRNFGFKTVRGSSSAKGAVQSTVRIIRELKRGGVLAHTPDGPRGPSHHFHEGAVFMALRAGCAIVPCGIAAYPRVLISTWDSYMVPFPFSKGSFCFGDPLYVPHDSGPEDIARIAAGLGKVLDDLESQAEAHVLPRRDQPQEHQEDRKHY